MSDARLGAGALVWEASRRGKQHRHVGMASREICGRLGTT